MSRIRLGSTERSRRIILAAIVLITVTILSAAVTRPSLVSFAIEEKVAENPAWTPEESVGPPLNTTLILVEDKDGTRCDHFAFRVDETAGDAGNEASASGFEDE